MLFSSRTKHTSTTFRTAQPSRLSLERLDDRIVPSSTPVISVPVTTPVTTVPVITGPVSPIIVSTVTSGQIISETNGVSQYGVGSWVEVVTHNSANQETETTITTYSGGIQVTDTDLITKIPVTGVKIEDHTITTKTPTGSQTVTRDYTYTPEGSGVTAISEVFTDAKGKVSTDTGLEITTTTSYGSETDETLMNSQGQTKTEESEHVTVGNATATVTTGINFNGQAFESTTLKTGTVIPVPKAD